MEYIYLHFFRLYSSAAW